jgi:hypothetical protein
MEKKFVISFIAFSCFILNTYSQDRMINGTIIDYRGKPLAGVNIMAKDYPSLLTMSGVDGQFRLPVYSFTKALIFSFSGAKTQEVKLSDSNQLLVIMEYEPGKNPHPWNVTIAGQIYRSDVFNKAKATDSSWSTSGAPHANISIEIEYFISQKLGFGTGISINSYTNKAWLNNFNNYQINSIERIDKDSDMYYLYNTVNTIDELTTVKVISIPLKIKYRFKQGQKWDYFIDAGVKLMLTRQARVKATGNCSWQGYYPEYHVVLFELPEYGFNDYRIDSENAIENYKKLMFAFTASIGISRRLGKKSSLELGFNIDEGLSDLNYISPAHPADFLNTNGIVSKNKVRAIGFSLGFRHNFVKNK